jgi:hypothetical protein
MPCQSASFIWLLSAPDLTYVTLTRTHAPPPASSRYTASGCQGGLGLGAGTCEQPLALVYYRMCRMLLASLLHAGSQVFLTTSALCLGPRALALILWWSQSTW